MAWARQRKEWQKVGKKYEAKVSGKSDKERPQLSFENKISNILEEGHVRTKRFLFFNNINNKLFSNNVVLSKI